MTDDRWREQQRARERAERLDEEIRKSRLETDSRLRRSIAAGGGAKALMAWYGVEPNSGLGRAETELLLHIKLPSLLIRLSNALERAKPDIDRFDDAERRNRSLLDIEKYVEAVMLKAECRIDKAGLGFLLHWCREDIELIAEPLARHDPELISDMVFCLQALELGYK